MGEPSALRPWWRRAVRRRSVLGVTALTVAVLALLATLAVGLAVRAPTTVAREALRATPDRLASVTIAVDGDPVRQDAAFRALVRRTFGVAPVEVEHHASGRHSSWTVRPRVDAVRAGDLRALAEGFATLPDAAARRFAAAGGTTTHGSAARTTTTTADAVVALHEAVPVPVTVLAVAGGVALTMLARLLVAARVDEDRLVRARGGTPGLLVRLAALEALAVAVPAALVGAAAGQALLAARYGPPAAVAEVLVPVLGVVALAVGAATASALVGTTSRPIVRTPLVVTVPALVLLVAVAAVAVWRFRTVADHADGVDPIAVVAPAAAVTALAAVAALALGGLLTLAAHLAARRRDLGVVLAGRLAARDLRVHTPAATLLVLAVATGVLAAGVGGTSAAFLTASTRIAQGGALRATVGGGVALDDPGDLVPAPLRTTAALRRGTVPVLRFTGGTPTGSAAVIGVAAPALPRLLPVARTAFDAPGAATALRSTPAGVALGRGRVTLRLVSTSAALGPLATTTGEFGVPVSTPVTAADRAVPIAVTAWVADAQGDLAPVSLHGGVLRVGTRSTSTAAGSLPTGGPWHLVAVDLVARPTADVQDARIAIGTLRVGPRVVPLPARSWTTAPAAFGQGVLARTTDPGRIAVTARDLSSSVAGGDGIRLMPSAGRRVPVVVTARLARAVGLHVGSAMQITGPWAGLDARVVGTVPVVPGTDGGPAVLADLDALDQGMLAQARQPQRVQEVWAADAGQRDTLRRAFDGHVTLTTPASDVQRRFLALDTDVLLLGAAGGLAFALLTLVAAVAVSARDRVGETIALRAVGVRAGTQGAVRAAAPAVVVVHGLVAGVLAGALTAALVVAGSARTSVPGAPPALPVAVAVAPGPIALTVGVVLVVGALVVLGHGVAVTRGARRSGGRG
ncbi:hypothetical protein [Curtobacterium sp. MCBD17_019]|uniref:hypothetical protein n=1 Tax=Curtobacterium sp. MCBD17_019 TaxID=2175669 RepID=UPI000DA92433|nr:hypothetical protein [Curtobacterium sp. MCBD17_019]PZE73398.1 hypothetical protein DEI82_14540 [Curtobacterium sp. MCBD17_019]